MAYIPIMSLALAAALHSFFDWVSQPRSTEGQSPLSSSTSEILKIPAVSEVSENESAGKSQSRIPGDRLLLMAHPITEKILAAVAPLASPVPTSDVEPIDPKKANPASSSAPQEASSGNLNIQDEETGDTLLHGLIQNDNLKMTNLLFRAGGVNINAQNKQKQTPLHVAILKKLERMFQLLLEKGADVNAKDNAGKRPLHYAVDSNQKGFITRLLDNRADINAKDSAGHSPLYYAVKNNRPDIVQLLLHHGASFQTSELSTLDSNNITSLYFAAEKMNRLDVDTAKLFFVDLRMDVNAKDENGNTPLLLAARRGNLPIVSLLFENGADATATNSLGYTLLHQAVLSRDPLMVQYVLELPGINIDAQNQPDKKTALHLAAEKANLEIVELLVEKGANVHLRDENNSTALHSAVKGGNSTVVLHLLFRGTDVNAKDNLGYTPLHWAAINKDTKTARLLLRNEDIIVNATNDGNNNTPLHIATMKKDLPMVELLLKHNADADAKNSTGHTPRQLAGQSADIADLLKQRETGPQTRRPMPAGIPGRLLFSQPSSRARA